MYHNSRIRQTVVILLATDVGIFEFYISKVYVYSIWDSALFGWLLPAYVRLFCLRLLSSYCYIWWHCFQLFQCKTHSLFPRVWLTDTTCQCGTKTSLFYYFLPLDTTSSKKWHYKYIISYQIVGYTSLKMVFSGCFLGVFLLFFKIFVFICCFLVAFWERHEWSQKTP